MSALPKKPVVPAKKPANLKFVRAQLCYQAQEPDELSFEEGDLLYIIDDKSTPDWWKARCRGKEGLVPANYVQNSKSSNDEGIELSPLHDACRRGNLELLEECLVNRVPVNAIDKVGNTPLHWAAIGGHLDCVQRLIAVGPALKLSPTNRLGETPLHLAAVRGNYEVILALRKADEKLDLTVRNSEGKTALDVATDPAAKTVLKRWISANRNDKGLSGNFEYDGNDYAQSDEEESE